MQGRSARARRLQRFAGRLALIGTFLALAVPVSWITGVIQPPALFRSPVARALLAANVTFLGFLVWSTARIVLETERARVRLQDAIRSRDEVLAVVSHDLRNLISPILMGATWIERVAEDEKVIQKARLIQRSTTKMEALIQDLLDLAAVESGQLRVKLASCPPGEITREAVETQMSVAQERGITLLADIADDLPAIRCDRERILQVFSNLLGNALKFTPSGGTVAVRTAVAGGKVVFTVWDTGPGLEPAQAGRIFERHVRGDDIQAGVGLGLFISQRLMEAHGSRITVETAPGKGCAFSFSLPIAASPTEATRETAARLT